MKYKYLIKEFKPPLDIETAICMLGDEGWKLILVIPINNFKGVSLTGSVNYEVS